MLNQPPSPIAVEGGLNPTIQGDVAVLVPTRNRPERLTRCLDALAAARERTQFDVLVCDSSQGSAASTVAEICADLDFVELIHHDRVGAAAARNVGVQASSAELIVHLDDDVYVEPDAIAELVAAYEAQPRPAIVAATVKWSDWWSRSLVMRRIGYGRAAEPDEEPEYLISALILYPRSIALALPWNERLFPFDDLYASLVWRAAGAPLVLAENARAHHDEIEHDEYPVANEADRVYVNIADAGFVTPRPLRLLGFEVLGFAAAAKKWARSPRGAYELLRAWVRGHRAVIQDRAYLRATARRAREMASESRT